MSWLTVLLFLLKYGPTILNIVREIYDLIQWLRGNSAMMSTVAFMNNSNVIKHLDGMASRCKDCRSPRELIAYRDLLAKQKEHVLASRSV